MGLPGSEKPSRSAYNGRITVSAKPLPERVTDPHRQRGAGEVRETVFSDDAAGES